MVVYCFTVFVNTSSEMFSKGLESVSGCSRTKYFLTNGFLQSKTSLFLFLGYFPNTTVDVLCVIQISVSGYGRWLLIFRKSFSDFNQVKKKTSVVKDEVKQRFFPLFQKMRELYLKVGNTCVNACWERICDNHAKFVKK